MTVNSTAGQALEDGRTQSREQAGVVMADEWVRDGHTARVVLDQDTLLVYLSCPNESVPTDGVEWQHLPSCRKNYDEGGQPALEDSPLSFCNFAEWATSLGAVIDSVDTDITRGREFTANGEFPIGWRWDCGDEMYVWAPSALIDAASQEEARRG